MYANQLRLEDNSSAVLLKTPEPVVIVEWHTKKWRAQMAGLR
jgi:hypothetical protein